METAMLGAAGFIMAVGVVSSIIFMLSMRADRGRDGRRDDSNTAGGDAGSTVSGIGGFSLTDWFSSSSSSSSCFSSPDSSCGDSGAGDSGGGGGGD